MGRLSVSKFFAALVLAGSSSFLFAGADIGNCAPGTLSSYISNTVFPGGGCAIGILDYYNFTYHPISSAPLASDIFVGLSGTGNGFSFSRVDGTPFTANLGQIVKFEIDFAIVIDPAPILSGGDMSLDPPSGNVTVTQFYCNDNSYVFSGVCLGGLQPEILQVGTIAPLKLVNSITFAKPAAVSQQVGILFTLDGSNGVSKFDSLDSNSTVVSLSPEPVPAAALVVGFLCVLGSFTLRKRKV